MNLVRSSFAPGRSELEVETYVGNERSRFSSRPESRGTASGLDASIAQRWEWSFVLARACVA